MNATKTIAYVMMSLLAAATFSTNLQAQDNLIYFPYVVNDAQTSTDLILTNASGRDANVHLLRFREDGTIAGESSVQLRSASQVVIGPSVSGALQGWILAFSDVPGVLGNVRVGSINQAAQDMTPAARPGTLLVFPFGAQSDGSSTEIAVVNPTTVNTLLSLTLYARGGNVIATHEAPLASFAMRRGTLSTIFGNDKNYANASHVIARSSHQNILSPAASIVGFQVVRDFARIPDDPSMETIFPRTDWAALPAIPSSSVTTSLTFGHANRGMDWFSLIGVVNPTGSAQTITLTYAASAGATTRTVTIPGNGSMRMTASDLFGPGEDSGSVRVTGSGNLTGFLAMGTLSGSGFASAPGQNVGQTEFFFPSINDSGSSNTGIALFNNSASSARVDLFWISPQGATMGRATEFLLPQQRSVKLFRESFIEGLSQAGGYVFVRSTMPVAATAVMGVLRQTISQFSAQPTLLGFTPRLQTRFGIRGRITDNVTGNPVSEIPIILSRPEMADVVVTTDGNGEYLFSNLAAGDYAVRPTQSGQMFAPVNPVVQVGPDSRIVNFVRERAPVISAITVVTNESDLQRTAGNNPHAFAIFGTSQVSLKIEGSNFIPGQTVFFGSLAVPAENVNFVSPDTIFVRLDLNSPQVLAETTSIGSYGAFDTTIGGQNPFGEFRSNAKPFYILPPLPVLLSVAGSSGGADTLARYEVNSVGENLTITGYGFRAGAQLLFDGRTALNGIEIDTRFVSSTQLTAYLPAQALRSAGIYTLRVRNVSQLPEVSGEAVTFVVYNLRPAISSISPTGPLQLSGPGPLVITLTINGSNFHASGSDPAALDPGTTVEVWLDDVLISGAASALFVSSNQLIVTGLSVTTPGTYSVFVNNHSPGGGRSNEKQFLVTYVSSVDVSILRSTDPLSPASVPAGSPGFNLTVFRGGGGAFQAASWVNFGTVRLDRIAGDTDLHSITVFVPSYLIASPGIVPVTVTNPGSTGGTSNRVYLTVTP